MQYVLCITLQIFKLLIGWKLWRVRWNTIIWVLFFFFLNLTRTRLRKAEFCESYQNEQKSLQLQGRRLRLRISRSHWFRVKKQLVTYRINIWFPSNKTLLYCGYSTLKNSFDKQAKAGSLRGKYFRINRRTSRLRVSFNCNYKLKE